MSFYNNNSHYNRSKGNRGNQDRGNSWRKSGHDQGYNQGNRGQSKPQKSRGLQNPYQEKDSFGDYHPSHGQSAKTAWKNVSNDVTQKPMSPSWHKNNVQASSRGSPVVKLQEVPEKVTPEQVSQLDSRMPAMLLEAHVEVHEAQPKNKKLKLESVEEETTQRSRGELYPETASSNQEEESASLGKRSSSEAYDFKILGRKRDLSHLMDALWQLESCLETFEAVQPGGEALVPEKLEAKGADSQHEVRT